MTIRHRLTALYTGLLAIALTLFCVGLYVTLRYSLLQQVDRQLLTREAEIRTQMLLTIGRRSGLNEAALRELLAQKDESLLESPGVFVEVWDPEHRTSYRTPNLGSLEMGGRNIAGREQVLLQTVAAGGERVRLLNAPISVNGNTLYVVRVGQSLAPVDRTLERLALLLAAGTLLTTVLAGWAGLRVAERALAPVASMIDRAGSIVEQSDLDTRLPVVNPDDELGRLAATFNEALERIDRLFQAQRRFVADAAHELRTPLTSIRGHSELLRRGAAEEPDAREEALAVIESEAARLTRLVNDLLLLAQSEAQPLEIMQEPVSLLAVAADVLPQQRLLSPDHQWRLEGGSEALVRGDRDRLHQLLINLLDNARTHTPPGTTIRVHLAREAGGILLQVEDNGPGIPPGQVANLFEPFFRGAAARRLEGSGLGLAIAARIVAAHGGTIRADEAPGGGARFSVQLPALAIAESEP